MGDLITLVVETIKSTCVNDYSEAQINAWVSSAEKEAHWTKFVNDQYAIVAEINNKIVGLGSLESGSHLDFMYVHKNYLGLGIASRIYNALEVESKELGFCQMTADVSKTALPFFKSKGFEVVKENENIRNNVTIINYHMVNSLD